MGGDRKNFGGGAMVVWWRRSGSFIALAVVLLECFFAISFWAAVQGDILSGSGEGDNETRDIFLLDVAPLNLSTETVGGVMSRLIPRNTRIRMQLSREETAMHFKHFYFGGVKLIPGTTIIPTKKPRVQTNISSQVFKGEMCCCRLYREIDISRIHPASGNTSQIEVTFEVDANGILNIKAEDKGTGKSEKIKITNNKCRLSQGENERMVHESDEFAGEDKKVTERICTYDCLEPCNNKLYRVTVIYTNISKTEYYNKRKYERPRYQGIS